MSENDPTTFDLPRPEGPRSWRQRLDEVRGRWTSRQLAAGALLCVGVILAAVALLRPGAPPPPVELSLPMASAPPAAAPSTTAAAAADVVVHATGAVATPGVYRLEPGSRVTDLVAAAGGLAPDADSERVNLAALLHDGERVAVPRVGEPAPAPATGDGSGSDSGPTPSAPVDLNTATATELEALPGLGPATAQAVVDDRTRNGPFRSVDDLQRVRGIGPAKLEQLHGLVTV
ncbi:MAG: ComEA family DNA-binding protein [Acidimicrobiales bacterium]